MDSGHHARSGAAKHADASWLGRHRAALVVLAPYAPYLLLGLVPVALWAQFLPGLVDQHALAFDFHQFFYPQARDVIEGRIPPTAYPPLTTLLFVPLATLSPGVADAFVTALMFGCVGGTLVALGVKDWRCYGAALLWPPVYGGIQTANVSLVLALGVALVWRWRTRAVPAGVVVALVIALKLFLWPLAGWLLATRRWRAAVVMVGVGVVASAAAWAVIGFGAITHFPELLRQNVLANKYAPYTLVASIRQLGAPATVAYAVCWSAGAAVLAVGARTGRRGREADALALFIAAALVLSPIVWVHYLVLLLVPVALARPRFSGLWLAPLPLWLCPEVGGNLAQKALVLAVATYILWTAIAPGGPGALTERATGLPAADR